MTTAVLPVNEPGLLARLSRAALRKGKSAVARALTPHKASLARLYDMPLTVLGISAVDFASFHYVHMIGWLVTGLSLIAVEHLIADEA